MRLDKFLGNNDIGTRQEVKKIIRSGRVKINGILCKEPDSKINENTDQVSVDDKLIEYEEFYYIMLNKPAGYVCSSDEKGQQSILELINEPFAHKLFSVGRLDKDTEGLLLLTNDGKLSHNLLAPGKHVTKLYYVETEKLCKKADYVAFENGIDIGDEKLTLPAKLLNCSEELSPKYLVEITEGRFHQIKRMFEACDNCVCYLKRVKMKNLSLDPNLKLGEYRRLTKEELDNLFNK